MHVDIRAEDRLNLIEPLFCVDGEIQAAPAEDGEAKKEDGKEEAKEGEEEVKSKPSKAPKKKVSGVVSY